MNLTSVRNPLASAEGGLIRAIAASLLRCGIGLVWRHWDNVWTEH